MFGDGFSFSGSFAPKWQEQSLPPVLVALVNMLLEGPSTTKQTAHSVRAETLTITQMIPHNSVKHQRHKSSSTTRHGIDQECPLPLYIGMMIHAHTRKCGVIDKLFELGICCSYDKVLQISTDLANAV